MGWKHTAGVMALLQIAACHGFTEVPDGGSPDSTLDIAANVDGAATSPDTKGTLADSIVSGGTGPGPHGALPTGFCCTENAECRYRECAKIGDQYMCVDRCGSDEACRGLNSGFECDRDLWRCEPVSTTTQCVPADEFTYGAKKLGACCTAFRNGTAGLECEGGYCGSFGPTSNPFICTQPCVPVAGCPTGYSCMNTGEGYGLCIPVAETYSCDMAN
jgi:hypothetical protein